MFKSNNLPPCNIEIYGKINGIKNTPLKGNHEELATIPLDIKLYLVES